MNRSRVASVGWLVGVIGLGLASRSSLAAFLPDFVESYAGDTLWALMVFLMLGIGFPRARTGILGAVALVISFSVECSQLYQADWINGIRATRIGALALGSGWVWTDLICYSVGIAMGVAGEGIWGRVSSEQ